VAQLYPQALGTYFSSLLRHAWVTVGLFFNPGYHTGNPCKILSENQALEKRKVWNKVLTFRLTCKHIFTSLM
jgi:hypothetical protein